MTGFARGQRFGNPAEAGRTETATRPHDPRAGVVALQRSAGNRAVTRLLMRQPTTTATRQATPQVTSVERAPDNADQVIVWMDDGTRFRVTRKPVGQRVISDPGAPTISLESDRNRVWMRIAWCRGTRGQIDVGANPQGALSHLMQDIGQTIVTGGGTSQVIQTIRDAELEPFAEVDIAQSRQWRITANVGVSVNSTGLQGVTGNAELDVGWMRVGLQGSVTDPQGSRPQTQVGLTFTFPLGPREAPRHRCEPQVVDVVWGYFCQQERLRTIQIQGPDIPRHADDTRFIYFRYATADVETDRSRGELDLLRQRLSEGYRVMSIEGYTSPEGARGAAPRFMGNVALSDARAQAALATVSGLCPEGQACTDPAATVTGRSERPPLTRTVRRRGREEEVELEGRELETAVVAQFTADENEMGRLPAAEQERIRNERRPNRAAQLIYPWLRRVEIRLRKDWIEPGRPVSLDMWLPEGRQGQCEDPVRAAAIRHWFPPAPPRR